jgi:hypothetical protein
LALSPVSDLLISIQLKSDIDMLAVLRSDSRGNMFVLTQRGLLQRFTRDGVNAGMLDFADFGAPPLDVRSIVIGPDDTVYVSGFSRGYGGQIYAVPPGSMQPHLYDTLASVEPCQAVVTGDATLHLTSYDTAWMNDAINGHINDVVRSGRFDMSRATISDVGIRRVNGRGLRSGYHSIDWPIGKDRMLAQREALCDKLLAVDARDRVHLIDRVAGTYDSYSTGGDPLGQAQLDLAGGTLTTGGVFFLKEGTILYELLYSDEQGRVLQVRTALASNGTLRFIPLAATPTATYELDHHLLSDTLVQYAWDRDKVYVRLYRVDDLLRQ